MTATSVRTARITPSKVKKLRSLWARSASSASLKVSDSATRLLRNPAFAGRVCDRAPETGDRELFRLSNSVPPKASLRGTADTNQYGYRSPSVLRKWGGHTISNNGFD